MFLILRNFLQDSCMKSKLILSALRKILHFVKGIYLNCRFFFFRKSLGYDCCNHAQKNENNYEFLSYKSSSGWSLCWAFLCLSKFIFLLDYKLGFWRVFVQDVSLHSQSQLHSIHCYINCYLSGAICGNCSSYAQ